ncbi:hypothetical protein MN116_002757 [Schistosoma mekongi]|uniref:Uncharacterized protein n=1 Tax=Schistosoma mekongi TaxID=38744 RepID=A0AAE1ZFZ9_SCHME|nr:hypothetical protein MN116_002757 [Schistosoma mekongi]
MKINILLKFIFRTTLFIMIVNNMISVKTHSWQTILRLAKRHTQQHDIDILKTALNNYANQMNNRKYIHSTIHQVNLTQGYDDNFTDFNMNLDNPLIQPNYSSDTNDLADDFQQNNLKNYLSDQIVKSLKNTNRKSNMFTSMHSSPTTYFTWSLLQFLSGLLCFFIHIIWFIWLLCHAVLSKLRQKMKVLQFEVNSHSNVKKFISSDVFVKHQQLTMHAELHLGFVGTIYGFIISIKQISSLFIDAKSSTSLDQSNLINRNYVLCYFTRHILLGLLTVYWITLFIIILINIHYIKSIYFMNTPKIPLISNIFVILYISFIISWIFSIVIRIGNFLINYNLQKFTLKHLTDLNHLTTRQILNFECINTKYLEHQKIYFHTVCNRTLLEQWLEIITNVLSDILPNFLVFTISIFNCFISLKSKNNSDKHFNTIEHIVKHLNCNNVINNNENIMKLHNQLKDLSYSSQIYKEMPISTDRYSSSTSCLTYQCDVPIQNIRQSNQTDNNMLNKQISQLNVTYKLYEIMYFSNCLFILSFCLLINHFIRLIIYGNLMRSQVKYCDSWNFNQGINEPENVELFKLIHENLHLPHKHLQGCILVEIFITTFIPIVCFTMQRCKMLLYRLCFKVCKPKVMELTQNEEIFKQMSENTCDTSTKTDYINLSKLSLPINSYLLSSSSSNIDDLGNQSTVTASLSSTTQCHHASTDTVIPPCELLKLQMFTRAQFEQKLQNMPLDKGSYFKSAYTNFPECSNENSEQHTSTAFVPVSIKLVNLQPFCCQPCDIFTSDTKVELKSENNVVEHEYLNDNCLYPIETTASVVKLHVLSDSSGFDE